MMVRGRLDPSRKKQCGAELAHKFNPQHRMQLDAVLSHSDLAVEDVKETHAPAAPG